MKRAPARTRDVLLTATWSAKEACLKALHLGLVVDTRSAVCLIEPVTEAPQSWTPFEIQWDVQRLNRRRSIPVDLPPLVGWWRILDSHILTLAAQPFEFSIHRAASIEAWYG